MASVSLFLIPKLYLKIWSFIFLSGTRFVSKANNLIIQKRYHRLLFLALAKLLGLLTLPLNLLVIE